MLEYWASMYSAKIDSGDPYKVLKPSISILITNFKLPQLREIEEYHTKWNLREAKHLEKVLTEDIEMHILEIPKIKETKIKEDELALWLKFIENPISKEVQQSMEKKENKYLKQAMEELGYLSEDPDFKRLIEARAGFLRDQEAFEMAGREEGLQEGREETKKEIAKKFLKLDVEIEKIMQATGLTKEEIENLK
jgi:predicted transposase/invertase (TIGR01784 family)